MKDPPSPRSLIERFTRWLDQPQPIERLAFLRILLPLVLLGFLSSRLVHADHWLSPVGFRVPDLGGSDWRQPLYLPPVPSPVAWVIAVATTIAGVSLAAGLLTRLAAGSFTMLLLYLALADRLEAFTVSKLAPMLSLVLLLSPSGARYGLDAWRVARLRADSRAPTHVSGAVIRFLQIFLVVMYFGAGVAKLRGGWLSGNVLWSHLHSDYQTDLAWLMLRTLPGWAWQVLQDVTLAFEVGAPLWFSLRWTRQPALIVGLTMHAMIGLMFGPVLWFALLMSTLLLGVYAPERWFLRLFRARAPSVT